MLHTVIFDYGNTLVHVKERELVATYTDDPDAIEALVEVFFSRVYWDRLDEGTLSHDDWIADAKTKLPPALHPLLPTIAATWFERLPVIEGMDKLVSELHAGGIKLYLLSNISKIFSEHRNEIAILKDFDGILCSADHQVTKPAPAIYQLLIDRFSLSTNGCLFVDDKQENLDAAEAFGIKTYRFDGDVAAFRAFLEANLRIEHSFLLTAVICSFKCFTACRRASFRKAASRFKGLSAFSVLFARSLP